MPHFKAVRSRSRNFVVDNKADLWHADLQDADLQDAGLQQANLYRANLQGANLKGADLYSANMRGANLYGTNLYGANLHLASLPDADLRCANLQGASLKGADLEGAKLPPFQIPQEGSLTVFKKVRCGRILKLLVPEDSKRTATLVGRKCRCEYVITLEGAEIGCYSFRSHCPIYRNGEETRANRYNDDIRIECAHGIHFFLTREEAENFRY